MLNINSFSLSVSNECPDMCRNTVITPFSLTVITARHKSITHSFFTACVQYSIRALFQSSIHSFGQSVSKRFRHSLLHMSRRSCCK
ncbi:hypothetical protein NXV84_01440 [Bacteroides fragilis]|uniref:hypothetical protein n=1 Tax=Bacteroides fragilis TaxID=817 RepID=UPI0012D77666|nr:hypothetical protein [Bacteroides fragilis]MCS2325979.1 hypothetical protein [Bacteroides fragilis]